MRKLKQQLQVLLIAGVSAFTFAPAFAEDLKVTANNYVRAETDFQMKGYIENYDSFGKFSHFREPYDVDNQVTVSGNRDTLYSVGVFGPRKERRQNRLHAYCQGCACGCLLVCYLV